jgi:protoporphyrinogen oxidase
MSGSVLVIGAGLTGLSAARELGGEAVVLEASGNVGGLCRSYSRDGYTFDISGHLLHFRRPAVRRFVGSLLPRQLARHERRAYVFFRGKLVDYPFQAHLSQLPEKVRQECLDGFLEAEDRKSWAGQIPPGDFASWIRYHFGPGIARHFLEPYNRKMWQVPLADLDTSWAEWAVPVPTGEEITAAATGDPTLSFGYNPVFFYPKEGGIGRLVEALADESFRLHLGEKVVEIDLARRKAVTARGRRFFFEKLISTAPLTELLRVCKGISPSMVEAGEGLRYVSVCVFNIGLSRPGPTAPHWIYFPGRTYPFYRVGFASNFCPATVPEGCQSLYVEVSRRPDSGRTCHDLWDDVRAGLVRAGIMHKGEEPAVLDIINIPCAYVLYDRHRSRVLPHIHRELQQLGIHSIGRYGTWEYSTMEDALVQGRETARKLRRQT